jgi:LPPG:FO 2-phospho-L-lactate transferase
VTSGKVVVLAGGTGGAKLARGMLDVVGAQDLVVIANTGDDIDIYGAHVSPDPDLITFWLADLIDERGWGLRGDTFTVMDELRRLGRDVWFNLGDRDLAWCLERRRLEDEGATPTDALRGLAGQVGVEAEVLPMSDGAQYTFVNGQPLQEFLIRAGGQGPISSVSFSRGDSRAGGEGPDNAPPAPSPQVLAALSAARTVIIGPSNPVISIWPILRVIDEALAGVAVPVVAVSPVVGGEVLKGPTDVFLDAYGLPTSASGVVAFYADHCSSPLAGIVTDEPLRRGEGADRGQRGATSGRGVARSQITPVHATLATLQCDTLMADAASRRRVAEAVLAFADSLPARDRPGP